jgi:hypothetical protein
VNSAIIVQSRRSFILSLVLMVVGVCAGLGCATGLARRSTVIGCDGSVIGLGVCA